MIHEKHLEALERVLAGKPTDPHDGFLAALTSAKLGRLDQMLGILKLDTSIDRFQLACSIAQWGESKESIRCLEWLLDNGINVNQVDAKRNGWTIAHSCALDGTVEMMRMLVERDANIRALHLKTEEVIHKALHNKNIAMFGYLLSLGIDPDLMDSRNCTLIDRAISDERSDLVELLISHGASKGRHRVVPKPIQLKPNRYRRCLKWEARKFGSRVGAAPTNFVEWMQRHELPHDLAQLFSEMMPLEKISFSPPDHDIYGDLCDAESIVKVCDWLPRLTENGLLPIAEIGSGDSLILDFIGGGRVGLLYLESIRSLNPRVEINFNFAPTLGDAIRKCLDAPRW